ncbi:MAG: hypothetical protein LBL59_12465 [Xanthomonadaceae bacterium]|jgi:hypothetical protein|nr:hypothetical protein [Xanthomonadaceae bacterium]
MPIHIPPAAAQRLQPIAHGSRIVTRQRREREQKQHRQELPCGGKPEIRGGGTS